MGEGEHDDQGPVGMLGFEIVLVGSVGGVGNFAAGVASGGLGDGRGRSAIEPAEIALAELGFFFDVYFDDFDGLGGARLHTGWGFAFGETVMSHVAFADDASFFRKFGDVEGALEDAVRAADALVVEVAHDAGLTGFLVGLHGATVEAFWVGAVVAGGGDGLLPTGLIFAA